MLDSVPENHLPPVRKKRGAIFIVIVVSIAVHLLAGSILAVIKITEVLKNEAEFEAPPLEAVTPPPPPPPPPPTATRTQRSMPRPQPLAAQNPMNMEVPVIEIDRSNMNMLSGRGLGGGLGSIGGGVMDSITSIKFFGMESSGGNVAILFDATHSGAGVFPVASEELIKTIQQVNSAAGAQLAVIYFGGKEGGHVVLRNKEGIKKDFWYPRDVKDGWLSAGDPAFKKIINELRSVQENPNRAKVGTFAQYQENENAFFLLGTNYWGALNEAYNLKPPPDTVYLIVEPRIAFPGVGQVEKAFERFKEYGRNRPSGTKVIFIVTAPDSHMQPGKPLYDSTVRALELISGGSLTEKEIKDSLVMVDSKRK